MHDAPAPRAVLASQSMRIPHAVRSSYPLRDGNFVRPLVDGIPAFRAILAAVEAATQSVWVTVAFLDDDFVFPDGHGSLFDVLERAARRGLDVRVLFWSEPEIASMLANATHFPACGASVEAMAAHAPHVLARWDRLRGYCHHQKSWLVDAGTDREVAFVGGINLDHDSVASPGHPAGEGRTGTTHDVYAELRGPSATDVHHNFVQRWNEASERFEPCGAFPTVEAAGILPFPERISREAPVSIAQVARTIRSGTYRCDRAAPGGAAFAITGGESSIVEQYLSAIAAAERTIYLENQILLCPYLFSALDDALSRGVDVAVVVPARAMPEVARVRRHPMVAPAFAMLDGLARHRNFLMAALGTTGDDGSPADIYVHSKVAVIDDEWATIGSANAMFRAFRDDTEMNVTVWDRAVAAGLRTELFAEHIGLAASCSASEQTTGGSPQAPGERSQAPDAGHAPARRSEAPALVDDRAGFGLLRDVALDNSERRRSGAKLRGSIFAIQPTDWAVPEE